MSGTEGIAYLLLRRRSNRNTSNAPNAMAPSAAPTPIPAFAPVLRPGADGEVFRGGSEEVVLRFITEFSVAW
jgi:hypothetical protein